VVSALLDAGAKPTIGAPVAAAARGGNTSLVRLLLDRGANVEQADRFDRTGLDWVATTRNVNLAELLLERGANVNRVNRDGQTPLAWAAGAGAEEMVALLLDRKAEPNLGGALAMAAWADSPGSIRRLMDKGASRTAEHRGKTPWQWAQASPRPASEETLKLVEPE
jgi:ankyrin repeat protein